MIMIYPNEYYGFKDKLDYQTLNCLVWEEHLFMFVFSAQFSSDDLTNNIKMEQIIYTTIIYIQRELWMLAHTKKSQNSI